jgi:hypothetical protein
MFLFAPGSQILLPEDYFDVAVTLFLAVALTDIPQIPES